MGRFQMFAFAALFLLIMPNGFLLYDVAYLLMVPSLKCLTKSKEDGTQSWVSCPQEQACNSKYSIDYESDLTITNIVTESHLECASESSLAMTGTYFMLGVFLSFVMWIKCSDLWARKPIILLGSLLQITAYTGVLFFATSVGYL